MRFARPLVYCFLALFLGQTGVALAFVKNTTGCETEHSDMAVMVMPMDDQHGNEPCEHHSHSGAMQKIVKKETCAAPADQQQAVSDHDSQHCDDLCDCCKIHQNVAIAILGLRINKTHFAAKPVATSSGQPRSYIDPLLRPPTSL